MNRERVRRFAIACLIAGGAVLVDQASKATARAVLSETERIPLIGDVLGLQLAFNPGAILSLGSDVTWVLTLVGVVAVVALFIGAFRARSLWWAAGMGFLLGGAIGNLADRMFSPPGPGRGYVTDFLAYGNWFIGNLADVMLGIGVIILVVGLWVHRGQPARPDAAAAQSGSAVSEP